MRQSIITCPDCGAQRVAGDQACPYCGLVIEYDLSGEIERPNKIRTMSIAALYADAIGIAAVALNFGLQTISHNNTASVFTSFDCTVVPISVGFIVAFATRKHTLTAKDIFLSTLMACGYAFVGAIVLFQEGVLCILIAFPLLYVLLLIGVAVGKVVFLTPRPRLNMSFAPLILFLLVADGLSTHSYTAQVSDTIVVNARASDIWPYLASYPPVTEPQHYWLWSIGLPKPIQSVSTQPRLGGERTCLLTGNTVLKERISQFTPDANFTFDIVSQKGDLELVRHLVVHRGQFILKQNANGTTTVTGTTWYDLKVFPGWYFNFWATDVVRHVHLAVMQHIANLAEARAAQHILAEPAH